MAVTVQDVCTWMEKWADPALADPDDNPGLLVGHRSQPVQKVLTALDATEAVIEEAVEKGCQMIVTHHPVIYRPISRIEDGERQGRRLLRLAENKIALFSAHTNLDAAEGGTNDVLAQRLELENYQSVPDPEGRSFLRIGYLPEPMTLLEFSLDIKKRLGIAALRVAAKDGKKKVRKVALCTGAGSEFIPLARKQQADVYITGDISYHRAEEAVAQGLDIVDAGHFNTEVLIAETMAGYLRSCSQEIQAFASHVMQDVLITI